MSDAAPAAAVGTGGAAGPVAPPRRALLTRSLPVVVAVVAADQLTKHWAVSHLGDGHADHLLWTLQLKLTFNSGMAFSRGQGLGPIIGLVALVVVVTMLVSLRRAGSIGAAVATAMVIGGALGNVSDRLFRSGGGFLRGKVVDFVDLQWYPVFNVADAALVIGGILLVLMSLRTDPA